MKKGFAPIIVLILVVLTLITGVSAYFWYQKTSPKIPDMSKELAEQQSPAASPTDNSSSEALAKDETANWKTYQNSKIKYTFKYPTTWNVSQLQGSPEYAYPGSDDFYIKMEESITKRSISFINGSLLATPSNIISRKTLNINGITTTKNNFDGFVYPDTGEIIENTKGETGFHVSLNKEDGLFVIGRWQSNDSDADEITDQILSTLKFTK